MVGLRFERGDVLRDPFQERGARALSCCESEDDAFLFVNWRMKFVSIDQ